MAPTSISGDDVTATPSDPVVYTPSDVSAIFRDQHERLLRIAFLLSGDHGTAEDVVADAFVRCYPHLARGRVDNPGAYLRRAVVNGFRRKVSRRMRERRERDRHLRVVWSSEFADESAERHRLLDALALLTLRQRSVVVLRFFDDRSEAETAAVLGISPGAVKTHSHRALARLRTILQEEL